MVFHRTEIELKDGRRCVLRSACVDDAHALLAYLKRTASETPYLVREPDETAISLEQERAFIQKQLDSERELLLIAEIDGAHVGNCSISALGAYKRYAHRCSVAIALYQAYCGFGIGGKMLQTVLDTARQCGYEQAELEVVRTNEPAVALYKKLGFAVYGIQPHSMKYSDGTYADGLFMQKPL